MQNVIDGQNLGVLQTAIARIQDLVAQGYGGWQDHEIKVSVLIQNHNGTTIFQTIESGGITHSTWARSNPQVDLSQDAGLDTADKQQGALMALAHIAHALTGNPRYTISASIQDKPAGTTDAFDHVVQVFLSDSTGHVCQRRADVTDDR